MSAVEILSLNVVFSTLVALKNAALPHCLCHISPLDSHSREQNWHWTHPHGTERFCFIEHRGFLSPDLQWKQLRLVWLPNLLTGKGESQRRLMLQSTSKTAWWRLFLEQPDSQHPE